MTKIEIRKVTNKLWWKTLGKGNHHLVLLHGWGLSAEVWSSIGRELSAHFTLHLVDLPGFGRSQGFGAVCFEKMAKYVLESAPDKAIWLGWSFGGLIASQIALMYPEGVQALVTVASSPCFSAQKNWPGIKPEMLSDFQKQLSENFQRTIERFLSLQVLGAESVRKDMRTLKKIMSTFQILDIEVLNSGLEILKKVDLRKPLADLFLPHLRIYGYLDNLVPCKVASILDVYWPRSESLVIKTAAHAPFISHQREFCNAIISLSQRIR